MYKLRGVYFVHFGVYKVYKIAMLPHAALGETRQHCRIQWPSSTT